MALVLGSQNCKEAPWCVPGHCVNLSPIMGSYREGLWSLFGSFPCCLVGGEDSLTTGLARVRAEKCPVIAAGAFCPAWHSTKPLQAPRDGLVTLSGSVSPAPTHPRHLSNPDAAGQGSVSALAETALCFLCARRELGGVWGLEAPCQGGN